MDELVRKMKIQITILCVLLICLVLIGCYWFTMYIFDIQAENGELKEQNKCYQILYNEDIIGVGCDKYFQNDSWYIEYKKEVVDNE